MVYVGSRKANNRYVTSYIVIVRIALGAKLAFFDIINECTFGFEAHSIDVFLRMS